ncbi:hypothetical protein ACOSQ3_025437 [Xanthoceras sorbifolium]
MPFESILILLTCSQALVIDLLFHSIGMCNFQDDFCWILLSFKLQHLVFQVSCSVYKHVFVTFPNMNLCNSRLLCCLEVSDVPLIPKVKRKEMDASFLAHLYGYRC